MTKEEQILKKEAYITYLTGMLDTAFNIKDWHEQNYGESLTDQEVNQILGNGRLEGATLLRMGMHIKYMNLNR